ncbi:MAG: hypothetical protein WDN30_03285 [Pararobbsia sp.]
MLTELGQVVGPEIEDRAAARLEEELGVRMPVLHAVREHGDRAADRPADAAAVDRAARGLVRRAEEGIGRAAHAQALGVRRGDDGARGCELGGERLLEINVRCPPRAPAG